MRFLTLFVLVFVVLAGGGCRSIMDPTFMPAGYSYHGDLYKSPPGPEADKIGYPYSKEKNAHILNEWQVALDDLVQALSQEGGGTPLKIYLETPLPANAFSNAYGFALREALRKKGFELAQTPSAADAHVTYTARTDNDTNFTNLNKKTTYRDFDLTLKSSDGQSVTKTYNLPSYGFTSIDSAHNIDGIGEIERTRSHPLEGEQP